MYSSDKTQITKNIPFCKVTCNNNELEYIKKVLKSGWLTTGNITFEFEKKFSEFVGAQYACAVNSCTSALHLGLESLGIGVGDKVIVPSMTFTASAEVVRYLGADPIICDVAPHTRILTPEILEQTIIKNPAAKAVIIVHFGGYPADINKIKTICDRHGISILEDAAHAFPTKLGDKYVGSLGDSTCFSFYANKTITTGEGGMFVTKSQSIYERVKLMRLHGINKDVWSRYKNTQASWEYDVIQPGFKYNMPDILSAIGLAQLEQASKFRNKRQRIAELYYKNLSDCSNITLPMVDIPYQNHSWHLFPIMINKKAPFTRNEFISEMSKFGIGLSVHYKPLHRMTYYKQKYNLKVKEFPNSEDIWKRTVSLPIYPALSREDIAFIIKKAKDLLNTG